jgi:hypothetical protein
MKVSKKVLYAIILIVSCQSLLAQERLGIVNSTYSGISGSIINPASTGVSPYYLDINLLSVGAFADNNLLYLSKNEYQFKRFFQQNPDFPTHGPKNSQIFYDYYNTKNKWLQADLRVLGPSAAIAYGKHTFGFVTGARAVVSAKNIPYDIAKFGIEQFYFPPQFDIIYNDRTNIRASGLGWAEFGLNYAYNFKQIGANLFTAGITVKALRGYAGSYLYADNIDYIMLDRDTLIINNTNALAGFSAPIDFNNNNFLASPLFRGRGIGVDIGIIFEKKRRVPRFAKVDIKHLCSQKYVPYIYKIGLSILDIGRVKFKDNARALEIEDGATYWPQFSHTSYNNINDLVAQLSNRFYGNPTEMITGDQIKIALPTAVSVQFDYNFYNNFFVNASMVQPIQISKSGIIRSSLLSVTPRYQTQIFEFGVPVTQLNWTKTRVGAYARFRGLTVGTEKLGSFFHFSDFTGFDVYVAIRFALQKGNCRNTAVDSCGNDEYKLYQKSSKAKRAKNRKSESGKK